MKFGSLDYYSDIAFRLFNQIKTIMKNSDERAVEILMVNFSDNKLMNIAELTTKYSKKELVVLLSACVGTVSEMARAERDGNLLEFFPSRMFALNYASYLTLQAEMIDNALTDLKNANTFHINTIEGVTIKSEMFLN